MKLFLRVFVLGCLAANVAFAQLQLTLHGVVNSSTNLFSDIAVGTEIWATIETNPNIAYPVIAPPGGFRLPATESIWTTGRSLVTDHSADIYVSPASSPYGIEPITTNYFGGPGGNIILWSSWPTVISGNFLSSTALIPDFYYHYGTLSLPQTDSTPSSYLSWNIDSLSIAPLAPVQAVPEPSSYCLFSGALLALVGFARMKRRSVK